MRAILVVFILIGIGCSSQSTKNNIDKTALPLIETFFKGIQAKRPSVALDELLKNNPHISLEDSSTLFLKRSFVSVNEMSGTYKGFRVLKKRFIEEDIGIYSCLAKYEKKFYRFIFMFYNNGDTIRLYKFLFDEDIDEELEGSLKFYTN
ncbi:hypothetical protein LZZ85_28090 [Terrimonas sp. NA20]|uniref:DUF4252 domain-containing protein n=1 Tax=Terrimonas ginsenosidimutans TaxID=2908004 RepID=A0ABS9L0Q0_9BACT|nr:hypothetical protein [Terrimonas ginsenosidimutans]MCG2618194.1 hypothetical protein [Terrimonas ginsenosidimutans]